MLNYILHNLDRYPLDGVVHFELKIDEIEKERQKLATAYHLSIDDVKPITAQAAELLKTPLNGIAN